MNIEQHHPKDSKSSLLWQRRQLLKAQSSRNSPLLCHCCRNKPLLVVNYLVLIFLVSVSPHKSWRVFWLITVRLHEVLNFTGALFIFSEGKGAGSFSYYFLCCLSNGYVPFPCSSPQNVHKKHHHHEEVDDEAKSEDIIPLG